MRASPAPKDNTMQQAVTYQQRSRGFLTKAYAELDQDLSQAGEKGWGAAAAIVKAIAVERGWPHQSHRTLQIAVSTLVRETGDQDLRRQFDSANALHINFYENWYDRDDVELRIQDVEQFVAKVEALLSPNP